MGAVQLRAQHIGQVLGYKGLILQNKPNVKNVHCFVFGYEKGSDFVISKDAELKTFSESIAELRAEYREYAKIIEDAREVEDPDED